MHGILAQHRGVSGSTVLMVGEAHFSMEVEKEGKEGKKCRHYGVIECLD